MQVIALLFLGMSRLLIGIHHGIGIVLDEGKRKLLVVGVIRPSDVIGAT